MAVRYIKPSGQGGDYTTLAAWEAQNRNLVTAQEVEEAVIDGDWSATTDSTPVTISGWTTSSTYHIKIYTTAAARHDGKWNTAKYRLHGSVLDIGVLEITVPFVWVSGLQLFNTNLEGGAGIGVAINNTSAWIRISHNVVRGNGTYTGYWALGIDIYNSSGICYVWNNIVYDFAGSGSYGCYGLYQTSIGYLYNNTAYNGAYGIQVDNSTCVAKNNLVAACTDAYSGTFASGTDYNATDINDTPGQGSNNRVNQTFSFVNASARDLHLTSSDTGARDYGINLSSDANLPFSDDIDEQTRTGAWDIGADEFVSPDINIFVHDCSRISGVIIG